METETTSSIEPVAWAWARWVRAQSAAIATTTARQIATMPAGGRLLRAVPYSSPILKSVCSCGVEDGCGAGGGGVDDGLDMGPSYSGDCTRESQTYAAGQACFMAFANPSTGRVLSTSVGVSQARRACSTPNRIFSMCEVWCESVLITIFTPCCLASLRCRSQRSSRSG